MNIHSLLNYIHRTLGRYRLAVRLAILLRNQARAVIKYYLNEDANFLKNGEALLVQTIAPNTSTFIDVGANIGNWTSLFLEAAPKHAKGILFDPSDRAVEKLRQRFKQVSGIEIIKVAISDTVGEMPFFEEPEAGETSSLVVEFSNPHAIKKFVNVTTLDTEVENLQWESIDFLKIDTEGYDLHVLRGASSLLSRQKIGIIQFEYNAPWALTGSCLATAYNLLKSFGYKVFLLKSSGLFELNYKLYGEYFSYSNFVAVSTHRYSDIKHLIKGRI